MPMRTGLFWAMAGANVAPEAANAPEAAADLSKLRRDTDMSSSLGMVVVISLLAADERIDLLARQFPVVIEIGDYRFHERLRELYRALLVG
jgi:hypothetical protein